MIKILGYIASFNTIISVWCAGSKNLSMWYLSMVNQVFWFIIGLMTKQYYLCLMSVCLQILNIRGWLLWRKRNPLKWLRLPRYLPD